MRTAVPSRSATNAEGSGAENAERIGQAIVHAARRSIKVCVGGILRDAVAQQDVCASRCRITGQNTFCPVEKEGMVCQQQIRVPVYSLLCGCGRTIERNEHPSDLVPVRAKQKADIVKIHRKAGRCDVLHCRNKIS